MTDAFGNSGEDSLRTLVLLAAVDWGWVRQAQHTIALRFAARGIRVLFVEPVPGRYPAFGELSQVLRRLIGRRSQGRTEGDGDVGIIRGVGLPEAHAWARSVNRKVVLPHLLKRIRSEIGEHPGPAVIQCWKPLKIYEDIIDALEELPLEYSYIDNYSAQYRSPEHYEEVQERLLCRADSIVANAPSIASKVRSQGHDVTLRSAAVDFELFQTADRGPVSEIREVAFFGAVSERIDFDILFAIARAGIKVSLVGPIRRAPFDPQDPPENFACHGQVPYDEVPRYLRSADCLLLTYADTPFTRDMRPVKIYECLATGKPTLATTHVAALREFSEFLYLADSPEAAVGALRRIPSEDTEEARRRRLDAAKKNSWERVIQTELDRLAHISNSEARGPAT